MFGWQILNIIVNCYETVLQHSVTRCCQLDQNLCVQESKKLSKYKQELTLHSSDRMFTSAYLPFKDIHPYLVHTNMETLAMTLLISNVYSSIGHASKIHSCHGVWKAVMNTER